MSCIESYIEHDLALVPIPYGQKGPNTSGWNERGKAIVDRIRAASITGNVGLAHQYCKRPTMALDIDDLEGSRAWFKEHNIDLDALLNAPDAVQITSGRPNRCKLVYRLPPRCKSKVTCQVKDPTTSNMLFELRCSSANDKTMQDVLPPSIHPDTGKPYTWAGRGSYTKLPTIPPALFFCWSDRQSAGKPIIKSTCLAAPDTASIGELKLALGVLNADDRALWVKCGLALKGLGDPGRVLWLEWSARSDKFDEADALKKWDGFHPTGIDYRYILNEAKRQSPDTGVSTSVNIPPEIADVNANFAWDMGTMNLYKIDAGHYIQKDRLVTQYANRVVNVGTTETPKIAPLGSTWLRHKDRRNVTAVRMVPGQPETLPDGSLNSWLGYACAPVPGDVEPFIKLLKRLVPDIAERRCLINWIATLIQNPGQKFNVAVVVWSSQQGTGKSMLFETIGKLFNDRHSAVVGQEVFNDSFTEWQAHKVFVICDEVSSTDQRGTADRIKGWITSSTNNINKKHEPKFSQQNIIKYVFLSNHADAVFLNDTDRRYFVVEATATRMSSSDATEFIAWRDDGGLSALLDYLQKINTKDFNPTAPAPSSGSKATMIEDNKSDLERWVDKQLDEHAHRGKFLVSAEDLAGAYHAGNRGRASSKAVGNILLTKGLRKLNKQARTLQGARVRLYALQNTPDYEAMTDTELGAEFTRQCLLR